MILMTNEIRKKLKIGTDAGIYDPIKDEWEIFNEAFEFYRPDLANRKANLYFIPIEELFPLEDD